MASQMHEVKVPSNMVENSSGLAIDIGGSLAKLVYRCKERYSKGHLKNQEEQLSNTGYLKLVSFPREAVETYVQYIKEHVDLTGSPPLVNSCGFGASEFRERLETQLDIRLNEIAEIDCHSLVLSKTLNEPNVKERDNIMEGEILESLKNRLYCMNFFRNVTQGNHVEDRTSFEETITGEIKDVVSLLEDDVQFPCLVAMCGSMFPLTKLNEDGTFETLETITFSGRCFHGMASIMTGEFDWTKIMDMIESHDGNSAYKYFDTQLIKQGDKPMCQSSDIADNKAQTSGRFKRWAPFGNLTDHKKGTTLPGDMLCVLFDLVASNIAAVAYNVALAHGLKHVIFGGSFGDLPMAKSIITREMMMRNMEACEADRKHKVVNFFFIKHGAYQCVLGTIFKSNLCNNPTLKYQFI